VYSCKTKSDKGGEDMNKDAIIELLECAKINVGNILKVGQPIAGLVKLQIDEAIKMLEAQDERTQ
jgi:hypothetical protein